MYHTVTRPGFSSAASVKAVHVTLLWYRPAAHSLNRQLTVSNKDTDEALDAALAVDRALTPEVERLLQVSRTSIRILCSNMTWEWPQTRHPGHQQACS